MGLSTRWIVYFRHGLEVGRLLSVVAATDRGGRRSDYFREVRWHVDHACLHTRGFPNAFFFGPQQWDVMTYTFVLDE